ncbi:MAG: HigA family addiction module antidote protein [Gammaproteobacteria bacterium]|nr:HigA family addiction module antidote protein [Gammaproteobacteria bacterium]
MAREYKASAFPALPPVHPGALLREETLPAAELSVTAAAIAIGVTRQTLHSILREAQSVTPAMALRLGKLFGNGPDLWLRMQQDYDLWHAQREIAAELNTIKTLAVASPNSALDYLDKYRILR